jgi:preprotein translocase subunit SecY
MTDVAPSTGWADRIPFAARLALLIAAVLACVFAIGVVAGVSKAVIEHGVLKPRSLAVLALAIGGAALSLWIGWQLSAYWRRPGQSRYERRYTRMIAMLVLLGLPIGMLLRLTTPTADFFSNAPLAPAVAAASALLLVVLLATTLVLYHRAIDDHEQQAYLWANSLAFYFLVLALPSAWLLARGGWIDPLGIGSALIILVAAMVINAVVWSWLKFR